MDLATTNIVLLLLAAAGGLLVGGVALIRTWAQRYHDARRRLFNVTFPAEMTPAAAVAALATLTGLPRPQRIELGGVPSTAFETVAAAGAIRYRVAVPPDATEFVRHQLEMHAPGARLEDAEAGPERWDVVLEVGLSPTAVLRQDKLDDACRTVLAALQRAQGARAALLQWIVVPVRGRAGRKGDEATFHAVGRLAARAQSPAEARALLLICAGL